MQSLFSCAYSRMSSRVSCRVACRDLRQPFSRVSIPSMNNEPDAQNRLKAERSSVKSWKALSDKYDVPTGVICDFANRGIEPKNPEYRTRLGLSLYATVYIVGGNIPEGCQVLGEYKVCHCGQRYVPNHPLRANCYSCRPVRKRKK